MAERPILFSGPMVRAILSGTKTMTRRLMTKATSECGSARFDQLDIAKAIPLSDRSRLWAPMLDTQGGLDDSQHRVFPRWQAGERLWVRETFLDTDDCPACNVGPPMGTMGHRCRTPAVIRFRADETAPDVRGVWRPSIHMPRWASRITLEVTGVRVERLQDITEEDARAEGVDTTLPCRVNGKPGTVQTFGPDAYRQAFALLWDGINGKRAAWASNPWVWVVGFRRVTAP